MTANTPTTNDNAINSHNHQLKLIADMGQEVKTSLNFDQLLHHLVYFIRDQLNFHHVAVFLLDASQQHLICHKATEETHLNRKKEPYELPLTADSTVGWASINQKIRLVHDIKETAAASSDLLLPETRSEIALPLITQGKPLGVLHIQSRKPQAFQADETVLLLRIAANQAATSIVNVQLTTQQEAHINETQTLLNLNNLLTTTLDVGEIYRRAARSFTLELQVARCAVSSWEQEDNTITVQAEFIRDVENNIIDEFEDNIAVYDLENFTSTTYLLQKHKSAVYHRDDPQLEESEREILHALKQTTCLGIPLVRGEQAVGVVKLYRTQSQPPFVPGEVQLAQAMANQTAIALDNAYLASEARGRVAQLSMLNRLSEALSLADTLNEVYEGARHEIFSLIEATGMSIMLLRQEKDTLQWAYGFEYGQEVDLTNIPPMPISQGFSGRVIQTNRSLLVNKKDIVELSKEVKSIQIGAAPSTWFGTPLIVANDTIGVLAVENEIDDNAFSERELELLKTIAGPLAIAINNLVQFETVQQALAAQLEQRIQLQTAAEIAAATTSILDLNELIQRAVDLIKERFSLYYVGLFLIDPEINQAVLQAGTGEAGKLQVQNKHQLLVGGRSLIGGATGDGVARITQNVQLDKEWLPNPILPDTKAELALPMRVRGRVIGALTVQSTTANAFRAELISILQTMSDQLAVAIDNVQLLEQAETQTRRQRELNQISARLYRTGDVNEIIRVGLKALSENLDGTKVELTLGYTDVTENSE